MITEPGTSRVEDLRVTVYESPFAARTFDQFARHVAYIRLLTRLGAQLYGEAAIASHMIWTQPGVLRDDDPEERALGIDCGLAVALLACNGHVGHVYWTDLGWSGGMLRSAESMRERGLPINERSLIATMGGDAFSDALDDMTLIVRADAAQMWQWKEQNSKWRAKK